MKWYGDLDALEETLSSLGLQYKLIEEVPNQRIHWEVHQCRVSYYQTTGTLLIQGRPGFFAELCRRIVERLGNDPNFKETGE